MFAGRVSGLIADATNSPDAGHVDDRAGALLFHDLQDVLHAVENAVQVNVHDFLKFLTAEVLGQILFALNARIVQERVYAPEFVQCGFDIVLNRALIRYVRFKGNSGRCSGLPL